MSEHGGVTRRALLSLAAAAVGLGGVAVVGVGLRLPDYAPTPPDRALDGLANAVLARSADYFLPRGQGFPPVDRARLLRVLDDAIARLDDGVRNQVVLGFQAFEVAAIAHGVPWRPFSELADGQAQAYVESWLQGSRSQRALVAALRQLVHVAYWQQPSSWGPAHYPGPLHLRADVPALGTAPRPLA